MLYVNKASSHNVLTLTLTNKACPHWFFSLFCVKGSMCVQPQFVCTRRNCCVKSTQSWQMNIKRNIWIMKQKFDHDNSNVKRPIQGRYSARVHISFGIAYKGTNMQMAILQCRRTKDILVTEFVILDRKGGVAITFLHNFFCYRFPQKCKTWTSCALSMKV